MGEVSPDIYSNHLQAYIEIGQQFADQAEIRPYIHIGRPITALVNAGRSPNHGNQKAIFPNV